MKLIRNIHSNDLPNACALTIGNFDAVHLGHRKILARLVDEAKQRNLAAVVMTFDPHPQEYFSRLNSVAPPTRLTTTSARFFALRECGVDIMLSLKFNRELAQTEAADFVQRYLADALRVKYLLVGDDFRFGAKRAGDFNLLNEMSRQYDYQLARFDTIKTREQRISSTLIRALLADGDLSQAAKLLGRNYACVGRIIHGDKRGREWGFPTVNLAIRHQPAVSGIFAVRVSGLADKIYNGVASLGVRPTLHASSPQKNLLEVFLFDFNEEIYGKRICVEFIHKIRDEEKFADINTLKKTHHRRCCNRQKIINQKLK